MGIEVSDEEFYTISKEIKSSKAFKDLNVDSSLNNKTVLKKKGVIIIGTITPPEIDYFYLSKRNNIYAIIEEAFLLTLTTRSANYIDFKEVKKSVKEFKEKILNDKTGKVLFNLEKRFQNAGITFIDVMDKVIRFNSAKDSDIVYYTLDYNRFNEIKDKLINSKIILNSDFAEECFKNICKKIGIKFNTLKNVSKISQRNSFKKSVLKAWTDNLNSIVKVLNNSPILEIKR